MSRFAAIDIGTNSVLLLVAERGASGKWEAVLERAEITRLGRGVDKTGRLAPEAITDTATAVASFVQQAQAQGVEPKNMVASATSAARDAQNGADFIHAVKAQAGIAIEIISGDAEAQLSFAAVCADFGQTPSPLICIDIGGGSTEFIYGVSNPHGAPVLSYRRSFDVGSVRMTERHVHTNPPTAGERNAINQALHEAFSELPPPPAGSRVVGVAGTVTTLFALLHRMEPYNPVQVQGGIISSQALSSLTDTLFELPLEARKQLPGLQPKRADVIPAGALILEQALKRLQASECTVSDRGLRWGLLAQRFST